MQCWIALWEQVRNYVAKGLFSSQTHTNLAGGATVGCLAARMPVVAMDLDKFQLQHFQQLASEKDEVLRRMVLSRKQLGRMLLLPARVRQLAGLKDDTEHGLKVCESVDEMFEAWESKAKWDEHIANQRQDYEEVFQARIDAEAKEAAEKAAAKAAEKKAAGKEAKKAKGAVFSTTHTCE